MKGVRTLVRMGLVAALVLATEAVSAADWRPDRTVLPVQMPVPPKYSELFDCPGEDLPRTPPGPDWFHPTCGWQAEDETHTHFVQFIRVGRAWGYDRNGDVITQPTERNPRFINSLSRSRNAFGISPMIHPLLLQPL